MGGGRNMAGGGRRGVVGARRRGVQAAHPRKGGPVARGRGGSAPIGWSRPWPQCGQRFASVPSTRERKASTVSGWQGPE